MRHAPSRIEYSEWTWRWTNGASGTREAILDPPDDGSRQPLRSTFSTLRPCPSRAVTAVATSSSEGSRSRVRTSLKGAARSASCNVLGDIAAQLQTDAENHKEGCGALVNRIESEFERVREAIKNLKPE